MQAATLILFALAVVATATFFVARKRQHPQDAGNQWLPPKEHIAGRTEHPEAGTPEKSAPGDSPEPDQSLARGIRLFMRGEYEEAFALLEPPAREGNLKAQLLMVKIYYAGHGVEADHDQYIYWLERAAENGDKPSKTKLKKIRSST